MKNLSLNILVLLFLLSANLALGDVVINEVMYNPSGSDSYDEFIEIYNNGDDSENLDTYNLCSQEILEGYINNADGNTNLETGLTLAPGEYALITDGGTGTKVYTNFDVDSNSIAFHVNGNTLCGGLDHGDTISITNGINSNTLVIDSNWGGNGDGKTLEKINGFINDNTQSNWQESRIGGTPGSNNNDAPTAENSAVTAEEDTAYIFTISDFNFADEDADDSLNSIKITGLETVGDLELAGVDVTLNQVIPVASITSLTFKPVANAYGTPYATFNFKVNDGTEDSASSYTATINVNPVNDAPTSSTPAAITINEDATYTFSSSNFPFSDIDGNTLNSIKITSLETVGDLELAGVDITLNQEIPATSIATLTFKPIANAYGTPYATFNFKVNDGTEDSVSSYTTTINVNPVNDDPVADDDSLSVTEDNTAVDITSILLNGDTDVESNLLLNIISVTPAMGTVSLVGGVVTYTSSVNTQSLNVVGTTTDSFTYTVSDGNGGTDTATVSITITGVNDVPEITSTAPTTAIEDSVFQYQVETTDVDGPSSLYSIISGTIGNMFIDPILGLFSWTPLNNNVGTNAPVTIQVSDGSLTDTQLLTLSVTNTNDAPTIYSVRLDGVTVVADGTGTAVQAVESTIELTVSDMDPTNDVLVINEDLSTFKETPLSEIEGIEIDELNIMDWALENHGSFDISLVVSDGNGGNSEPFEFQLNVLPALEINTIVVNGEVITDDDETTVSPGDEVQIDFSFINNYENELGTVRTEAYLGSNLIHNGICNGVENCEDGNWVLLPSESGDDSFTFEVPDTITEEEFTIKLKVIDDWFWHSFEHEFILNFEVRRNIADLTIVDAQLSADELSCTRTTSLSLNLANTGERGIIPQILVYSEKQTGTFDGFDATFAPQNGEELARENLATLSSGSRQNYLIPIGAEDLIDGSYNLYVYVVNSHIDPSDNYIADESTVELTIGPCVLPTLEISNVQVNGANVAENGVTTTFKPQQQLNFQFMVTNRLSHPVTGITAQLTSTEASLDMQSVNSINLAAGESRQISLTGVLPLEIPEGEYDVELTVSGRDYEDNTQRQSDAFSFSLTIEQEPADLVISSLSLEETTVTCASTTMLTVNYVNRGSQEETDATIQVKLGSTVLSTTEEFIVGPNDQPNAQGSRDDISILIESLSTGANTLTVILKYRDDFKTDTKTIVLNKNNCLASFTPTGSNLIIADGVSQEFALVLSDDTAGSDIEWFINNERQNVESGGDSENFEFSSTTTTSTTTPGTYQIKVVINGKETHTWTVTVTNIPLTSLFTTNLGATETESRLESFPFFTVQNSLAKIVFQQPVDLTDIFNLDDVITITEGLVSVDTTNAPSLDNQPAKITLFKSYTNYKIRKSTDGTTFTDCYDSSNPLATNVCTSVSSVTNSNGVLEFTVNDFSTYKVVENIPAALEVPTEVSFNNVNRGQEATVVVTIKNKGTLDQLTGVTATLVDVNSKYNVASPSTPLSTLDSTFDASEQNTLTVKVKVPSDESAGKHKIGTLRITSTSPAETKNIDIYLQPKSLLSITQIEVNGKESGKLSLEEVNKIEVNVENIYTEDMTDVIVTAKLLDVNGDDIEVESDSFDLDSDDDKTVSLDLDLTSETIDQETYTLEITVEGTADDDSEHSAVETKELSLDLETHKVIISKLTASNTNLKCERQVSLQATVDNKGKSQEDDIELTLTNTALGINTKKTGIELDELFGTDNSYRASFSLNLEDKAAGTYTLSAEVFRDGNSEDTEELTLTIEDCPTGSTTTGTTTTSTGSQTLSLASQQLAQELQKALTVPIEQKQPVTSSFRDTTTYTTLLALLTILVAIAGVLGMFILLKKRY
ncbi:lamin tail domain-containing protein [Candidatus Woesearchaeota archaeon]|nr:hypothetical protein [uncultured archaeon]MBS3123779.1 lamin tail domain-containing protein [Candidatus Woesearchaeota archaeon]